MTVDHLLVACVLLPTVGVVAAGTMSATAPTIMRDGASLGMSLQYADGHKALFRTADGLSLVMVGTSLPSAGRVTEIARREGHWTVTTTRNLVFTEE